MVMCFRAKAGKVAIWEKPPTGDPMAPFNDPLGHMEYVRFHSDLQYFNSQLIQTAISVNHASVAGAAGTSYSGPGIGSGSTQPVSAGNIVSTVIDLYTHDLGYVPIYFVLYAGTVLGGFTAVQEQKSPRRIRFVSASATTNKIRLRDLGISNTSALSATTRSYDVYIFKNLVAVPGEPLYHAKASTERLTLGHGKITADELTVRRTKPGDAFELPFPVSPQIDIRNGDIRSLLADGSFQQIHKYNGGLFGYDFVPMSFG